MNLHNVMYQIRGYLNLRINKAVTLSLVRNLTLLTSTKPQVYGLQTIIILFNIFYLDN